MVFVVAASRTYDTGSGPLTVEFSTPQEVDGLISCAYRFRDSAGQHREETTFFGVDSVQALIFCLTGAGDYLQRFEPTASFAGLPFTGLLATDLTADSMWSATVRLPVG